MQYKGIEIDRIEAHSLQDGDLVVFRHPQVLPAQAQEVICARLAEAIQGGLGIKVQVVVLVEGASLEVVRPTTPLIPEATT
jgi:hypothetical protein